MTRGASATAKAYTGPIFWLAIITSLEGTAHYFWNGQGAKTIDGHPYLPYLVINSGFRHTRAVQVDSGDLELDNVDLAIQTILESETFDGALCSVSEYLFSIDEIVFIMGGRLTDQTKMLQTVSYRLVSELDPASINTLGLQFAALCSWRFAKPPCGYTNASIAVTESLAEQAADIYTISTIGKAALSMTINEHVDRFCLITTGTGSGQARRIKSNTATTLTMYGAWTTTPASGSKFRIVTATYGLPKQLFTASSAVTIATADVHTSRTIGYSGLAMTTNEHASTLEDALAGVVRIMAGTGSGQEREIKSNTATTITIADDAADFSPVPDGTSQFSVLYLKCPKDIGSGCERRGRTHRFTGAPTVTPDLSRLYG